MNTELKRIPAVDTLIALADEKGIFNGEIAVFKTHIARVTLDEVRRAIVSGTTCPSHDEILTQLSNTLKEFHSDQITRVINATGIVLHTNLGRAPLSDSLIDSTTALSKGYCTLEFDLKTGQRGSRGKWVNETLAILTDAEKAIVVNNCAASVFLILNSLANGKEVIVSRGELVQIGGGFKIPDIMEASGAILKEVGTTNMTSKEDYENAITENTAMILKIHKSNFSLHGHTKEASLQELSTLTKKSKIILAMDLGSGALTRTKTGPLKDEATAQEVLRHGAELVCFSGDKLICGPQAGVIAGDKALVTRLAKDPLYRVLRPGRLILSALQEVLKKYLFNNPTGLKARELLETSKEEIEKRAKAFQKRLEESNINSTLEDGEGPVGGGSAPDELLSTTLIVLEPKDSTQFLTALRENNPPVIPRIENSRILLDLRSVNRNEEQELLSSIRAALQR